MKELSDLKHVYSKTDSINEAYGKVAYGKFECNANSVMLTWEKMLGIEKQMRIVTIIEYVIAV